MWLRTQASSGAHLVGGACCAARDLGGDARSSRLARRAPEAAVEQIVLPRRERQPGRRRAPTAGTRRTAPTTARRRAAAAARAAKVRSVEIAPLADAQLGDAVAAAIDLQLHLRRRRHHVLGAIERRIVGAEEEALGEEAAREGARRRRRIDVLELDVVARLEVGHRDGLLLGQLLGLARRAVGLDGAQGQHVGAVGDLHLAALVDARPWPAPG